MVAELGWTNKSVDHRHAWSCENVPHMFLPLQPFFFAVSNPNVAAALGRDPLGCHVLGSQGGGIHRCVRRPDMPRKVVFHRLAFAMFGAFVWKAVVYFPAAFIAWLSGEVLFRSAPFLSHACCAEVEGSESLLRTRIRTSTKFRPSASGSPLIDWIGCRSPLGCQSGAVDCLAAVLPRCFLWVFPLSELWYGQRRLH